VGRGRAIKYGVGEALHKKYNNSNNIRSVELETYAIGLQAF
jgi:hypothetical protein